MIYTSSCTVYIAQDRGFSRHFIPHCHFIDCRGGGVSQSGRKQDNNAVIYIPQKYAFLAPQNAAKDMIVKGECTFDFDNSTEQSASDSMKAFRKKYEFFTVISIEKKLYGAAANQHIKVGAK